MGDGDVVVSVNAARRGREDPQRLRVGAAVAASRAYWLKRGLDVAADVGFANNAAGRHDRTVSAIHHFVASYLHGVPIGGTGSIVIDRICRQPGLEDLVHRGQGAQVRTEMQGAFVE